jgi:DNA-binding beta-propeller fold protein YncE
MKRFLWLGFVLSVYLICTGCGDTFRPIIIPNPPQFPNPAASNTVVSINDNGTLVPGTAMVIDVSGDTVVSIANVGLAPVHAVQQTASVVLVANRSVPGVGSDSVTKLTFSNTVISGTTAIGLPAGSAPNFVATTESSEAYVLLPNLASVGVINTLSNQLTYTLPVGSNPVAMAETPNGTKLYIANEADSTISAFNTSDRSARSVVGTLTSGPIWLSARNDSQAVYVLESNGTLAWIDTTSTAGPDTLTETPIQVPGATIMTYDTNLNRLYIPGGQQMTMVDVSQSPPQIISSPIAIPPFALVNLASVLATATSAAALPDGTRAYVASYAVLPSTVAISAVSGDGTTATYTYSFASGEALNAGMTITVAGTNTGFDGPYTISAVLTGTASCPTTCFQTASTTSSPWTGTASGTASNLFPQVTVVDTVSNLAVTTIALPGFPDATNPNYPTPNSIYYVPVCVDNRFRFMMAAGGDSSRAYLSSCDGGMVDIIATSSESYVLNQAAPVGTRAPIPPDPQNPPQNPIFLLAGPP